MNHVRPHLAHVRKEEKQREANIIHRLIAAITNELITTLLLYSSKSFRYKYDPHTELQDDNLLVWYYKKNNSVSPAQHAPFAFKVLQNGIS